MQALTTGLQSAVLEVPCTRPGHAHAIALVPVQILGPPQTLHKQITAKLWEDYNGLNASGIYLFSKRKTAICISRDDTL